MNRFKYGSSDELKTMYRNGWVTLTVYNTIQSFEKRATFAEALLVRKDVDRVQAASSDGTCRSIKELTAASQRVIRSRLRSNR